MFNAKTGNYLFGSFGIVYYGVADNFIGYFIKSIYFVFGI